jgi:hypothetical protein
MFGRLFAGLCLLFLASCAENPQLSYSAAVTEQQCHEMYSAELNAWRVEMSGRPQADQRVAGAFEAFTNGLGLYQGEELFARRRAVCLERVGRRGSSLVYQPGRFGEVKVYACRGGGGPLQGGSAICPGH